MASSNKSSAKDPRTHEIIGAALEVHNELGCGFLEPVYQEALAVELRLRAIPFKREVTLPVFYKGVRLKTPYRVDFVCYDDVMVETKALSSIGNLEEAQLINYLKAAGYEVGLLANFGALALEHKRMILSRHRFHDSRRE